MDTLHKMLNKLSTRTIVTCIGVAIFYFSFLVKSPSYIWIETFFVLEIIILTSFTRTVSLRYGFGMMAQGVLFTAMIIIILWNTLNALGLTNTVSGEFDMALMEEVSKIVPVLVAAFFAYKNHTMKFNMSDFLFLGVMCAAGFSMFEKSFWEGISFDFTYGPHLGNIYFFPDALGLYVDGSVFGYIGHAAATGLVAMAVGLGFYFKHKKYNLWWIFPVVIFVWINSEHVLNNLYYVNGTTFLLKLGGGLLTPWIFIIFLIATLFIDLKALYDFLKSNSDAKKKLQEEKEFILNCIKTKTIPSFEKINETISFLRACNSLAGDK